MKPKNSFDYYNDVSEYLEYYVTNFDIIKYSSEILINILNNVWDHSCGFVKIKGKNVIKLELHTGGWTMNENIIDALQKNYLFWSLYWQKTIKGGHYYFSIPLKT